MWNVLHASSRNLNCFHTNAQRRTNQQLPHRPFEIAFFISSIRHSRCVSECELTTSLLRNKQITVSWCMRFSVVYKSGSDHRESDKGSTPISSELVFQTNNMEKGVLVFWIICLAIVIVDAKPFPQQESCKFKLKLQWLIIYYLYIVKY